MVLAMQLSILSDSLSLFAFHELTEAQGHFAREALRHSCGWDCTGSFGIAVVDKTSGPRLGTYQLLLIDAAAVVRIQGLQPFQHVCPPPRRAPAAERTAAHGRRCHLNVAVCGRWQQPLRCLACRAVAAAAATGARRCVRVR